MLSAVKSVRAAIDNLYAELRDEQKAQFNKSARRAPPKNRADEVRTSPGLSASETRAAALAACLQLPGLPSRIFTLRYPRIRPGA
jgi:hypothetical protein